MELNILSADIILDERGEGLMMRRAGSGLRAVQSGTIVLGEGASQGPSLGRRSRSSLQQEPFRST